MKEKMHMVHIRKIKTLYGLRYAVVDLFKSTTKDKDGNVVTKEEFHAVEYKQGDKVFPAIFPVTAEGLEKAKEIQSIFKKKKK